MPDRVTFRVMGEPKGKARPRVTKRGTTYTPQDTIEAEREVRKAWFAAVGYERRAHSGPVRVHIVAVFELPKSAKAATRQAAKEGRVFHTSKPDRDNIEKLILDALNGYAFLDDGQVAIGTGIKRYGSPARTDVTLEFLEPAPDEISPAQAARTRRVNGPPQDKFKWHGGPRA